jgi:hypothetical protein
MSILETIDVPEDAAARRFAAAVGAEGNAGGKAPYGAWRRSRSTSRPL